MGVVDVDPSTITLEEGGTEDNLAGEKFGSATDFAQVQARTDLPSGMLEIPTSQVAFVKQQGLSSSRPSSAGRISSKGNSNRNSGVMVEEEPPTWLEHYGTER